MPSRIVSIGDIVFDMILPVSLPIVAGAHQNSSYLRLEPGGAGNFMIAARHMGAEVYAVGAVGNDLFGQQLIEMLNSEGINTDNIFRPDDGTSTVVFDLIDQSTGTHTFVGHIGEASAVPYSSQITDLVAKSDVVYFQGFTFLEHFILDLTKQAVIEANTRGIPVYFDVGALIHLVETEQRRWILDHVDVLMMTEDEATPFFDGLFDEIDYGHLFDFRIRMVVLKQGPQGCTIIEPNQQHSYHGYKVDLVDTVGAGDCFNAAYIVRVLVGDSVDRCAKIANAMGAAAVQRLSAGRNAPTCEDAKHILDKQEPGFDFSC